MVYQDAFDEIEKALLGKPYYKEKLLNRTKIEKSITDTYPIIQQLEIVSFTNGTLTLTIHYNEPHFLMKTENGLQWIVYNNRILPYTSGTALGSSGIHINIALPEDQLLIYSGGIFWKTPSLQIARTIKQVDFITGFSSVTYYP